MNFWKIILATVVIFGSGVITGGLLVGVSQRMAGGPAAPRIRQWRPPVTEVVNPGNPGVQPAFDRRRMDFVLSVQRELDLSPEQRDRIEQIVREGQEHTREIMEQVSPQLRRETREVREQIRAVLTPEQRKRFEELLKQRGPEQRQMPARIQRDQRFPNAPRNPPPPGDEMRPPAPTNPPPDEP